MSILVKWLKTMISSIRFKNSGRKKFFNSSFTSLVTRSKSSGSLIGSGAGSHPITSSGVILNPPSLCSDLDLIPLSR